MAQQNIDFGTFPDDPDADAIRTAFQKTQENFTEIYAAGAGAKVNSINRTPGAGITVNSPTGNVIVTANIACVQVATSTLSIGVGGNGNTSAAITASSQTLYVDLPANISNITNINISGNLVANGNITGGNLATANTLSVGGNANIGNIGTGIITATGNVTAANIVTNGQLVSTVATGTAPMLVTSTTKVTSLNADLLDGYDTATAAIANTVVVRDGNGDITGNNISGTLTTAAQPNITSLGTLTSLSVSGNSNVGNLGTTGVYSTTLSSTGNSNVGNLGTTGVYATTLSSTGNSNVGNLGTDGLITATGNIQSSAFLVSANLSVTGNANVGNLDAGIITASGNITSTLWLNSSNLSVTGNTTLGNLTVTGNLQAGAIGIDSISNGTSNIDIIGVSGNITTSVAGNANILVVTGTGANVNGYLSVSGNSNVGNIGATTFVGNLSGSGNSNVGNIGATTFVGNLSGSGNSNVGNLGATGLVTGTLSVTGVTNLGDITNVHITGGSFPNIYIQSDGAGNLSWVSLASSPPGGANTYVQFNDNNFYGGASGLTFNKISNVLTVGNTVSATLLTGTLTTGAQPNITSVGTITSALTVQANFAAANISTPGWIFANTGNITGSYIIGNGSQLTDVTAVAVAAGNITGTTLSSSVVSSSLTAVGTLSSLTIAANGNITLSGAGSTISGANAISATYISGNGSALTAINASNISSGTLAQARLANSSLTINGVSISLGSSGTITASNPNTLTIGDYLTGTSYNGSADVTIAADATTAATASKLVARDANGNIAANNISGTLTTAAQTNITSVGSLTSLTLAANGNITLSGAGSTISGANAISATYISGNGSALTAINASNISSGTIDSARVPTLNQNTTGYAATVSTNAQPNITSVGTLTSLSVSGNANVGNIGATNGVFTSVSGTLSTASQTSITAVGTLTSLSSSGNITGANLVSSNYIIRSVQTGISAAGSTQGDATAITKEINLVSTVSAGNGVILPTAVAGMVLTITNSSATNLLVYPASGAKINSLATNAGFTEVAGATLQFIAPTTTQWYTVGATFA